MHQKNLFFICNFKWRSRPTYAAVFSNLLGWQKLNYDVSEVIRNANGKGFLLCWHSVIRQPELLLNKVTEVENIFRRSSVLRDAEIEV